MFRIQIPSALRCLIQGPRHMPRTLPLVMSLFCCTTTVAAADGASPAIPVVPRIQTAASVQDAASDVAIWVHPNDPGRSVVVTLVELPLVLPPAVAGIGLLAAFGRFGLLGDTLSAFGVEIAFTRVAVVLAIVFVAGPFFVRTAIAAFEAVDPTLVDASRTLGAGPGRTFARVALPLASGGLGAGAALAFARGLGEFGATIMFAGSLQGVTQTLSLAVYEQFDVDFDTALAIGAELVGASALLLLAVKLVPSWRLSTQSFPTPSARSLSS